MMARHQHLGRSHGSGGGSAVSSRLASPPALVAWFTLAFYAAYSFSMSSVPSPMSAPPTRKTAQVASNMPLQNVASAKSSTAHGTTAAFRAKLTKDILVQNTTAAVSHSPDRSVNRLPELAVGNDVLPLQEAAFASGRVWRYGWLHASHRLGGRKAGQRRGSHAKLLRA
ncbi:hypothetical protein NFJ02_30g78550 [Pycnococcus provasolii]